MKKIVIGILAHVDAGKTTLSESMLYLSGKIRRLGRVDKQDAYLDTYELEKTRGITIFSKQANFQANNTHISLLDTPGHIDFSAEMERTLQVLDYAILVISGSDGVKGHTETLWRLLNIYKIPVFVFVNKMDQKGTDKEKLMKELKDKLSDGCIDFTSGKTEDFYDQLAMEDEKILEKYLQTGKINKNQISKLIEKRKVFPCFFGSALKLEGVEDFISGLVRYTKEPTYSKDFGAKVFKISRDKEGQRLTHLKLTGGSLRVRDTIEKDKWQDKVNEIRVYSGDKYKPINKAEAGSILAVTGLSKTQAGQGLGIEESSEDPVLEAVLSYQIILPEGCDPRAILPKLRELEEEKPELEILWNKELEEIQAQIMGEIEIEILQSLIKERFDVDVDFDEGSIVYKETIKNKVEGVGHFEPLRHYAEVLLVLEPAKRGSGLEFALDCSEDMLDKRWQRLILSHLEEKAHKGVLTGSEITDIKITLKAGKAHQNHTEGGDFRQATYRAVRNGLAQAKSVLLEPYYDFRLELPGELLGRAMTDIDNMQGESQILETGEHTTVLGGSAPVANMRNYHREVIAYTSGRGRLFTKLQGYKACHNSKEVIEEIAYDFERDIDNPAGSVFCEKGAGFSVSWDKVKDYMHLESVLEKGEKEEEDLQVDFEGQYIEDRPMSPEEIDALLNSTLGANRREESPKRKSKVIRGKNYQPYSPSKKAGKSREEYLLVDGYNIIFDWPELKEMAKDNIDGARIKLLDSLSNYRGIKNTNIIVVFDAYRVKEARTRAMDYHNIHVVYTQEAQTADHYIERFVYDHHGDYNITVATSDALEQIIIRGKASGLLSARELREDVEKANKLIMQAYADNRLEDRNFLIDALPEKTKKEINNFLKNKKSWGRNF